MSTPDQVKREYDTLAKGYNAGAHLPRSILKAQLIASALGDCTGLHVLDLGGGPGNHARQAIDAGAASVDIIDFSDEMLRVALLAEQQLNRRDKLRTFQADVSLPLDHLRSRGLRKEYDLVMSNFCFDHASSRSELEGMWRNAAGLLRPGGRFVGAKVTNMRSEAATSGKYGITYKDFEEFEGGVRWRYRMELEEPIEFEISTLRESYGGGNEMMVLNGLTEIEEEPLENAQVVRDDAEFWAMFVEDPPMAIMKAVKRVD